jgi:hypothetical protein
MKKVIILLFSLSLLVLVTPVNDVNSQNTSYELAKVNIKPAHADPIYPPIG